MTASLVVAGIVACEDITDPPGDPVDITYALCTGAPDTPTWFAFQDGDGPWTQVTPTASGAFNFTLTRGRGGVAMFTPLNPDGGLFVLYASTEEMQDNFPNCVGSVRDVSGGVTGYVTADKANIWMGLSDPTTVFGSQTAPAPFTISGVDANATDLVAVRYRSTFSPTAFEEFPNNVFHRRSVTGTTADIDFGSSTEAGAPVQRTVNITNLVSGEEPSVISFLRTETSMPYIALYRGAPAQVSGSVTAPFYGIPATRLAGNETHVILVSAARAVGSTEESRFTGVMFTDPVDRSVTFGPALGSIQVSGSSRPSATYTIQAAYDNLFDVVFEQGSGASARVVEVAATSAYLNASTSVTLSVPDLSGASGFQATWLPVAGQLAKWTFLATDADVSILNRAPMNYQGADRSGNFTP